MSDDFKYIPQIRVKGVYKIHMFATTAKNNKLI